MRARKRCAQRRIRVIDGDPGTSDPKTKVDFKKPLQEVIIDRPLLGPKSCPELGGVREAIVAFEGADSLFLMAHKAMLFKCTTAGNVWQHKWRHLANDFVYDETTKRLYYSAASGGFSQPPDGEVGIVGALDASGKRVWSAMLPNAMGYRVALAPGGVYLLGTASGQLPGQPPDARGQAFVGKFSSTGKQEWVVQSKELGIDRLASDSKGNVIVVSKKNHQTKSGWEDVLESRPLVRRTKFL